MYLKGNIILIRDGCSTRAKSNGRLISHRYPLVIVAASALNSLRSCINYLQDQLWLLVPTVHPVGTIMFCSLVTGSLLLALGLKSIRIPLQRTRLSVVGTALSSAGIIFLAWSVVAFIAYLDELEHPSLCFGCPGGNLYESLYRDSAIAGASLGSIGTLLLLMNWKREVLQAHGYP